MSYQRISFVLLLALLLFYTTACLRGNECRSDADCTALRSCQTGICIDVNTEHGSHKEPVIREPVWEADAGDSASPLSCPDHSRESTSEYNPESMPSQVPSTVWAIQAGGVGKDNIRGTTSDALGNIYITGYFKDTATFGKHSLVSAGAEDIFLAKIDPQGVFVWATRIGGAGVEHVYGLTIDPAGNLYLTGNFSSSSLLIGTSQLTLTGVANTFVAKFANDGKAVWGVATSGDGKDEPDGKIVLTPQGHLLVAGGFTSSQLTLGTTTLTLQGARSGFIAAINTSGTFLWATVIGSAGATVVHRIAPAANGDIYIGGIFLGSITIAGTTLTPTGADGFVVKLNASGAPQWVEHMQGTEQDEIVELKLDPTGRFLIMAVGYNGDLTLGSQTLKTAGAFDVAVAKFDVTTRTYMWVRALASSANAILMEQHIAADGSIYQAGFFHGGIITFGGKHAIKNASGTVEGFAVKWSPCGDVLWAMSYGSLGFDEGRHISTGKTGEVYITGHFEGTVDFGGTKLTSKGDTDIFLWKLKE